jgi:hypothetical protein
MQANRPACPLRAMLLLLLTPLLAAAEPALLPED